MERTEEMLKNEWEMREKGILKERKKQIDRGTKKQEDI